MAALDELLARIEDSSLRSAIEQELVPLRAERELGLVFERHLPEKVRLPGLPVRPGTTVEVCAEPSSPTWQVVGVSSEQAILRRSGGSGSTITETHRVEDLVVVREFGQAIHPGLRSVSRVERGGEKPFHTVINAENYHALETLLYSCEGKVDVIYIDPPYNTGARDWKYNNDYVDGNDSYRHSKWLSFMEKRLRLAKRLLNKENSVLIVTIDEREYLRLGLLLEQTFLEARIQMVSVAINPSGQKRDGAFRRSDEYYFVVSFGRAEPKPLVLGPEWRAGKTTSTAKIRWDGFLRSGTGATRKDSPLKFYPIIIATTGQILRVDDPIASDARREDYQRTDPNEVAIWPIRSDGSEGRWQTNVAAARRLLANGFIRTGRFKGARTAISYLKAGEQTKLAQGVFGTYQVGDEGFVVVESESAQGNRAIPTTQWNLTAHSAADHGSSLMRSLLPRRTFPFPKSLYAVEDALRFFVSDKPNALVVDFFAGSGTTAHAVMRLNRQDGGRRRSIMVTNNEVGPNAAADLTENGLRDGDPEWEAQGIFEHITMPRIKAAVTGVTHEGQPIEGEYKFVDEFPMSEGFEENVEFFTLTYEDPDRVRLGAAFAAVAPLLWLMAGAVGPRIDSVSDSWAAPEGGRYGVLFNADEWPDFVETVKERHCLTHAFVVTDSDAVFQRVVAELPVGVTPVRLYESYLRSFTINTGTRR